MEDATGKAWIVRRPSAVWVDIVPLVLGEDNAGLDHGAARQWSLALESRGVDHRVRSRERGGGHAVETREQVVDRAVREVGLFLAENDPLDQRVQLADLRPVSGATPTVCGMILLMLFHWAINRAYPGLGLFPGEWVEAGAVRAGAMLSGEWWRSVTSLTLHADGAHVLGNALVGGAFIFLTARRLGTGLAWSLAIAAGALGNLVNGWIMGPWHNAVGFSTASFGAAGVLTGMSPFGAAGGRFGASPTAGPGRFTTFVRSWLIPAGGGLGLLAMLGAGPGTDLGAHLFGLLTGAVLGVGAGWLATRRGLPGARLDATLGVLTGAAIVMCWTLAWRAV